MDEFLLPILKGMFEKRRANNHRGPNHGGDVH